MEFLFKNSQIFGVPIPLLVTFEEVNLRFYVRRKDGDGYKRGVVSINETAPYKSVDWLANKVLDFTVDCNFAEMYGSAFAELFQHKSEAVFLAEGSDISVD